MQRLSGKIELAPVAWLETGLIDNDRPPHDAPESVWRQAHQERLVSRGLRDVRLLWGRPAWARLADLPPALPDGIRTSDTGIALIHDQVAVVLPTCCAGFEDISGWREATEDPEEEWQMLWIGHPWVNWRRQGSEVLLTGYCEDDPVAGRTPLWTLPVHALRHAVEEAEEVIRSLS